MRNCYDREYVAAIGIRTPQFGHSGANQGSLGGRKNLCPFLTSLLGGSG